MSVQKGMCVCVVCDLLSGAVWGALLMVCVRVWFVFLCVVCAHVFACVVCPVLCGVV